MHFKFLLSYLLLQFVSTNILPTSKLNPLTPLCCSYKWAKSRCIFLVSLANHQISNYPFFFQEYQVWPFVKYELTPVEHVCKERSKRRGGNGKEGGIEGAGGERGSRCAVNIAVPPLTPADEVRAVQTPNRPARKISRRKRFGGNRGHDVKSCHSLVASRKAEN